MGGIEDGATEFMVDLKDSGYNNATMKYSLLFETKQKNQSNLIDEVVYPVED